MKKTRLTIIVIITIIMAAVAIIGFSGFSPFGNGRVILIVTRDQGDTASLNPTRLQVAAGLALEDYQGGREKDRGRGLDIRHHYITYTGDEEEGYLQARAYLDKNPSVIALVGDFNSRGTEYMTRLAQEYQVPHLSFFSTDESLFMGKPWSFSYRTRFGNEVELMLQTLTGLLRSQGVIILASEQQNLFPRAEAFYLAARDMGLEIVEFLTYPVDENDFREDIKGMGETGEQFDALVLFLGVYQLEHFLQQRSLAGLERPVLTTGVVINPEVLPAFQGVDKFVFTQVPCLFLDLDKDPALQSFVLRYKEEAGLHRIDSLGLWIYDGFWTLYEALEGAENREQLKEALEKHDRERFAGPVAFDQHGLLKKNPLVPVQVTGGGFEEVRLP